jgi:hypothetical protein
MRNRRDWLLAGTMPNLENISASEVPLLVLFSASPHDDREQEPGDLDLLILSQGKN